MPGVVHEEYLCVITGWLMEAEGLDSRHVMEGINAETLWRRCNA